MMEECRCTDWLFRSRVGEMIEMILFEFIPALEHSEIQASCNYCTVYINYFSFCVLGKSRNDHACLEKRQN